MRRRDFVLCSSGSVLGVLAAPDLLAAGVSSSTIPAARVDLPVFRLDPLGGRAISAKAALRGDMHLAGGVMLTILGLHRPRAASPEFERICVDAVFTEAGGEERLFHAFTADSAQLDHASRTVRFKLPLIERRPAELRVDLHSAGRCVAARVRITPGFAPDLAKLREGEYLVPLTLARVDPFETYALHLRIECADRMSA